MRIYFVRHGESQANHLREISNRGLRHGLTRRGREQAVALAHRFQDHALTRIYSSPLLRAIETSVILAGRWQVDYEITDALREYDCGVLEGRSDEAAWRMWRELFDAWIVHHRWEERIEGGESFHDVRRRFEPFVAGLVMQYGGTQAKLACVAHGGLYGLMLPLVLNNVDRTLASRYGLDYTACIVAEPRREGLCCVEWNGDSLPGETR